MQSTKIFKPIQNSVDFLFHPKSFAILGLSNEKLNHFQSKMRWDIDSRLDMAHDHKLLFPPDLNVQKFDISENQLESYWFYHYPKLNIHNKQQREDVIAKTLNGFDLEMASNLLLEKLNISDLSKIYVLYFDRYGHAFLAQLSENTEIETLVQLLVNVAYSGDFFEEWVDAKDFVPPKIIYHHLDAPWNKVPNLDHDLNLDRDQNVTNSSFQNKNSNHVDKHSIEAGDQTKAYEENEPKLQTSFKEKNGADYFSYYNLASEEVYLKNRELSREKFQAFRDVVLSKSDDPDVIFILKTIEITESQVGFFKILNLLFQSVLVQNPKMAKLLNPVLAEFAVLEKQGLSQLDVYRFANKLNFIDYDLHVELKPLDMAIYRLFLEVEEGIRFKDRSQYKNKVLDYYLSGSNRNNELELIERIEKMFTLSEDRGPLDQSISRINAVFKKMFAPEIAYHYMITGTRGGNYGVVLKRNLLKYI